MLGAEREAGDKYPSPGRRRHSPRKTCSFTMRGDHNTNARSEQQRFTPEASASRSLTSGACEQRARRHIHHDGESVFTATQAPTTFDVVCIRY